jgi:hypothetical protein
MAIAEHKHFSGPARINRTLTLHFRLDQVLAVKNCHVSKTLNFGSGELEADEFAAVCLKINGGLEHFGLMFPQRLAGADHDGFWGHQLSEGGCIVGEPGTPDRLPRLEQLSTVIWVCREAGGAGSGDDRDPCSKGEEPAMHDASDQVVGDAGWLRASIKAAAEAEKTE